MRHWVIVAALVGGTTAFAEKPRIALVDFTGPHAVALKKQLSGKLCKTFTCVKPGKHSDVPVSAVVTAEAAKKQLLVSVYYDETETPIQRDINLKAGKVSTAGFKAVTAAVREALSAQPAGEESDTVAASSL